MNDDRFIEESLSVSGHDEFGLSYYTGGEPVTPNPSKPNLYIHYGFNNDIDIDNVKPSDLRRIADMFNDVANKAENQ